MKRIIFEPAEDEEIPDGKVTVAYRLPVADVDVFDVVIDDEFATDGTIHYDSTITTPAIYGANGEITTPAIIAQELNEAFVHHFAGWEPN